MLCKVRHYVPREELLSIYYAIFSSHLVYGCQIWGQSINIFTEKVFKLQNRAMQILSFADFDANTVPFYKLYNVLKLNDLIALQNCLCVHDFFNNKLPTCFPHFSNQCMKFMTGSPTILNQVVYMCPLPEPQNMDLTHLHVFALIIGISLQYYLIVI